MAVNVGQNPVNAVTMIDALLVGETHQTSHLFFEWPEDKILSVDLTG